MSFHRDALDGLTRCHEASRHPAARVLEAVMVLVLHVAGGGMLLRAVWGLTERDVYRRGAAEAEVVAARPSTHGEPGTYDLRLAYRAPDVHTVQALDVAGVGVADGPVTVGERWPPGRLRWDPAQPSAATVVPDPAPSLAWMAVLAALGGLSLAAGQLLMWRRA